VGLVGALRFIVLDGFLEGGDAVVRAEANLCFRVVFIFMLVVEAMPLKGGHDPLDV
jgi:hypothetical protein